MLISILYALLLFSLIYFTAFFNLFKDDAITRKQFAFLFLGKIIAVPVFLFVYTKMYGGINDFDTGKFYHDVCVIYDYGKTDLNFLARILFGLQDDTIGSMDYEHILKNTLNWDDGKIKDYLYNDNRVIIRIHLLLNFIAINSYTTHALLNCFLSFIGILFFYRTFKEWFKGKELGLLLILCFFPALWFYTGALLKEGISFFVLGSLLYQLKNVFTGRYSLASVLWLLFLLFIALLLKPYLLVFAALCFSLFFVINKAQIIRKKTLVFLGLFALIVISLNVTSIVLKKRSLLEAALKQQHRFVGVSRGGIFLADSVNFIRLTNDTTQIKPIMGKKNFYTIKKNVSYMYWKTEDQKDTLYFTSNKDTMTHYQLIYIIQPGNSNVDLPNNNLLQTIGACWYYTLFYPTLYSAKNLLQLLASFENLLVLLAFFVIVIGFLKSEKEKFLPFCFLFFALSLCLLIGLTAPNSGAIFRYRSPAMVFLLSAALYYWTGLKKKV